MIKSSAYGFLFNCKKFKFNVDETVANFCFFFDEVVCVTIEDEDNTYGKLMELSARYPNLKVIKTDINIKGNNKFDGQLKTVALQNTTNPIKVIVDFDEMIPPSNKKKWEEAYRLLMSHDELDGLLVCSLDCWGDEGKIRKNSQIGQKFRIHKDTIVRRGVPKFAELGNGRFNPNLSDNTEPLLENGELGKFASIVPSDYLNPENAGYLINAPHVFHFGYLDFDRKCLMGREFWKEKWESYSGKEEKVATDKKELENEPTVFHNLPLI